MESSNVELCLKGHFQNVWSYRHVAMSRLRRDPKLRHLLSGSCDLTMGSSERDASSEMFTARQSPSLSTTRLPQSPIRPPSRSYSTEARRSGGHAELPLENATVAQVEELLASSRRRVESLSRSVSKRRENGATERIGSRVLDWLQHLDGLDEEHIVSQQFCFDLGWFLVLENADESLRDWLIKEGAVLVSQHPDIGGRSRYDGDDKWVVNYVGAMTQSHLCRKRIFVCPRMAQSTMLSGRSVNSNPWRWRCGSTRHSRGLGALLL